MLDYSFIDTLIVRIYFTSVEDANRISRFEDRMKDFGLHPELKKIINRYNGDISYRIRVTFAKYEPKEYYGNDNTNLQPAPLDVYEFFFKEVLSLAYSDSNILCANPLTFDNRIKFEKIDITKQILVKESPDIYIKSLMKLKVRARHKSVFQNSCFYTYFPKTNYNRISNFNEVVKLYDKGCEIRQTRLSDSVILLKNKPSQYTITNLGSLYNTEDNSVNIKDLNMLRAEISLKDRNVDKLCKFLGVNKYCLFQYLYKVILTGKFYDKLNDFFVYYMKYHFYLPEIIEPKNKPLELFQESYMGELHPILDSLIREKAMTSTNTKNIVLNKVTKGTTILNRLINSYEPPIVRKYTVTS